MNIQTATILDIGKTIRALRLRRKLTGTQLANRAGMSQSKISKIENGAIKVSLKEAEVILNILECPKTIRQQVFAALKQDGTTTTHKFQPIINAPGTVFKRERDASSLRYFLFQPLPAILQTSAYRAAILKLWHLTPTIFSQKMKESLNRQDLLFDSRREFHFIIHEAALYDLPTSRREHIVQLDRLVRLSTAKNIRIGIIPVEVGLLGIENSNFTMYDSESVTIIFAANELHSADPSVVAEYQKIFGELEKRAHYDSDAMKIIDKAMDYFAE